MGEGNGVRIEETRTLSTDEGGSAAETTGQEGGPPDASPAEEPTGASTGEGGDAAPEGDEPADADAA